MIHKFTQGILLHHSFDVDSSFISQIENLYQREQQQHHHPRFYFFFDFDARFMLFREELTSKINLLFTTLHLRPHPQSIVMKYIKSLSPY